MLKKYNSPSERLHLLEIIGITQADIDAIQRLHLEVIVPNADSIVEMYYQQLLKNGEYKQFFSSSEQIARLKKKQVSYLLEMGIDCFSPVYFEERMRIGSIHADIGLPLSLYHAAYNILHSAILAHVPEKIAKTPAEFKQCAKTLFSVITLDMNLAIEAYHAREMKKMQSQLNEIKSTSQGIQKEAKADPLTKLYNREHAIGQLQELVDKFDSANPIVVIMADIDHFKQINDNHGHLVGDIVLKDIAFRIRGAMRSFDFVGRYGGEEFIIVLQNTDSDEGYEVAERIRQRIYELPVQHDGQRHLITISMGLSQVQNGDTVSDVIQRADEALYTAKNNGRNRVISTKEQAVTQSKGRMDLIKSSFL
jgi:diguanylate cyclase (GGDEF)-like protein